MADDLQTALATTNYFHCDGNFARAEVSYLTQRTILVNDQPDRFMVSPLWDPTQISNVRLRFNTVNPKLRQPPWIAEELADLFATTDPAMMAHRLDDLLLKAGAFSTMAEGQRRGGTPELKALFPVVKRLFICLWAENALAWPALALPFPKAQLNKEVLAVLGSSSLTGDIYAAYGAQYHAPSSRVGLTNFFLKRSGLVSIGDLVPEVCRGIDQDMPGTHVSFGKTVYSLQLTEYGVGGLEHHAEDLACPAVRQKLFKGSDLQFSWVVRERPDFEFWAGLAAEWLSNQTNHIGAIDTLNSFFGHAVAQPNFPTNPVDYLDRSVTLEEGVRWSPQSPSLNNRFREFLEWILDTQCSSAGDDDLPIRDAKYRNPLTAAKHPANRMETHRNVMPTLLVRLAEELLSAEDWKWARAVGLRPSRGGDKLLVVDASGRQSIEWCPARAVAVWVKLKLPFRTIQVRLLDSGEGDTLVYDRETDSFQINRGPLAGGTSEKPVNQGAIRAHRDLRSGQDVTVLHLNTNKTADIGVETWERGYDCPYAPSDVIEVLSTLAEWQSRYNPISGPTAWASVAELRKAYGPTKLEGRSSCFLFRDAASTNRAEPVSPQRVAQFWLLLMEALQRNLAERNIKQFDGLPYVLIDPSSGNAIFDLHSLRVTGITALYENGVSIEIIAKIVGHATVVMSLYYTKLGAYEIQQQLSEASAKRLKDEQRSWLVHLKQQALDNLRATATWNDESGLVSLQAAAGASIVIMDLGICPVGCQLCHIGGEANVSTGAAEVRWKPVPGGRRNCPSCRFLISGPPFLHGLIARFNQLSCSASDKAARRSALEAEFEIIDAERSRFDQQGEPFLQYREWQEKADSLDHATAQLDIELLMLNAVQRVVDQCRRILESTAEGSSTLPQLWMRDVSSIQVVVEETTDFDLFDRICVDSEWFASVDATLPNVRRQRAYDQMLLRNGLKPAFLDMDEATGLRVGNQLSRLLMSRLGRPGTIDLMAGKETFASLGLTAGEVERLILENTGHDVQVHRTGTLIEYKADEK